MNIEKSIERIMIAAGAIAGPAYLALMAYATWGPL